MEITLTSNPCYQYNSPASTDVSSSSYVDVTAPFENQSTQQQLKATPVSEQKPLKAAPGSKHLPQNAAPRNEQPQLKAAPGSKQLPLKIPPKSKQLPLKAAPENKQQPLKAVLENKWLQLLTAPESKQQPFKSEQERKQQPLKAQGLSTITDNVYYNSPDHALYCSPSKADNDTARYISTGGIYYNDTQEENEYIECDKI